MSTRRRTYGLIDLLGELDMRLIAEINTASSGTYSYNTSDVNGFLVMLNPNSSEVSGAFLGAMYLGISAKFHVNYNKIYTFDISNGTITYVSNAGSVPSGSTRLPTQVESVIDSVKPIIYIFAIKDDRV